MATDPPLSWDELNARWQDAQHKVYDAEDALLALRGGRDRAAEACEAAGFLPWGPWRKEVLNHGE